MLIDLLLKICYSISTSIKNIFWKAVRGYMLKFLQTFDEALDLINELAEKHTPEIEYIENNRYVTLKHHPMVEEHYIQFMEVYPKDKSRLYLKYLNPEEKAEFNITHFEENIEALEYCNIHGLWEKRSNND